MPRAKSKAASPTPSPSFVSKIRRIKTACSVSKIRKTRFAWILMAQAEHLLTAKGAPRIANKTLKTRLAKGRGGSPAALPSTASKTLRTKTACTANKTLKTPTAKSKRMARQQAAHSFSNRSYLGESPRDPQGTVSLRRPRAQAKGTQHTAVLPRLRLEVAAPADAEVLTMSDLQPVGEYIGAEDDWDYTIVDEPIFLDAEW